MLKPSRYNYFIQKDKYTYYGYNFLYRSILEIPTKAFQTINTVIGNDAFVEAQLEYDISKHLPEQWISMLKKARFLLKSDFDELSLIKMKYYENLFSNDSLNLIILPTLWCNFKCPYCFELKRQVFMNSKVEDQLILWINNNFHHKRNINVAWFGGEPLLGQETIKRLTRGIQKVCHENKANYSASITTNGYYLDSKFQAEIKTLGINSIQITLDGDRDQHDKLRTQLNGRGSFDKIYENILLFSENINDCDLTIRVNCGDDNYYGVKNLLERFPENIRKQTFIFFRWIWPNQATGYREFSAKAQGEKPFIYLSYLYEHARNLGWKTNNPCNKPTMNYCEVDFLDQYCIDPDGYIYLCAETFDKSEAIGSIYQKNIIKEESLSYYSKWYTINPFEDIECLSCKLLPACVGGCRKSRLNEERSCIDEKDSLDLFVKSIISENMQK